MLYMHYIHKNVTRFIIFKIIQIITKFTNIVLTAAIIYDFDIKNGPFNQINYKKIVKSTTRNYDF